MSAIGLFVLRIGIARPVARRVEGTRLRSISVVFIVASVIGLIAIPVYLDDATAVDSLHSAWDVGTLVPLFRITAFGRSYVDMEICFALFCPRGVDRAVGRSARAGAERSIAELLVGIGALGAAAAVLVIPGASGHAAQTAPRVLVAARLAPPRLGIDLARGSARSDRVSPCLPAGRRVSVLSVVIPRFSNVAFVSVLVLLASGTWATVLHMPILSAMWTTSYGQVILIKIGLLLAAMLLGAVNLVRTKPRLVAARTRPELGQPTAAPLRRPISVVEASLVTVAVFAAATLSSLAPPAAALAKEGSALAKVGPGPVSQTVHKDGYTLKVLVNPNKAVVAPNSFAVQITKNGVW